MGYIAKSVTVNHIQRVNVPFLPPYCDIFVLAMDTVLSSPGSTWKAADRLVVSVIPHLGQDKARNTPDKLDCMLECR